MKKILIFVFLCFTFLAAHAEGEIKVDAPNMVGVDEQFNVTFIIEGKDRPENFSWNPGNDFQIVWGPQKGMSVSTIITNGKRTRNSQYTYTYILLPKSAGVFMLNAASADIGGKQTRSESVKIEVVSNNGNSSSSTGSSNKNDSEEPKISSSGNISKDNLFLRLSVSTNKAIIGEPITAVLKLYQRVGIAGFEGAKFPTFNGFWSQVTESPTNINFKREKVGNEIYNSAVIRRFALIPQQAGNLVIEPAELICLVNVRTNTATSSSIFDGFFEDDYETVRKRVVSSAQTIHVSRLPQGSPASFGGGVGDFRIDAALSNNKLKSHEATSLVITVSGKGNVSLLEAPKVNFPPDIDSYDVKVTEKVENGGVSGSKVFEYPFIPRSHGEFTIDPVEYSYYDIASRKYVTLKTKPILLNVAKGKEVANSSGILSTTVSADRKGVKNLDEDIRFILLHKPSFTRTVHFFVATPLFYILAGILLLIAIICFAIFKKMSLMRADIVGSKNRKAAKMAMKRLKQAEDFLHKNLYTAFYEELHRAVFGFISDKLNMKVEDLNRDNIYSKLIEYGISEDIANRFIGLIDACDYSRYAPDSSNEAMSTHYSEAIDLISSIDVSMKNKKQSYSSLTSLSVIAIIFMLSVGGFSRAANINSYDSLWKSGIDAYNSGKWKEAINSWTQIEQSGVESSRLYYNLGNAYFKSGDYSHSILNYNRALKLNPSASDARYNLSIARNRVQDKIEVLPEFILVTYARKLSYTLSSNVWAVMSIIFFALMLVMLLLFLLSSSKKSRKIGFYTSVISLIICTVSFISAFSQMKAYSRADSAVVMKPAAPVKSSPSELSSKNLFVLHEGTEVKLLDTVGEWYNISLADGRQGWIISSDIEII